MGIALNAPKRKLWDDRLPAWFEYFTDRCGEEVEDDISEEDLASTRTALHTMVSQEAEKMRAAGTATPNVLLAGSSQGGSVALDAALTFTMHGNDCAVKGVAMLRS